MASRAATRDTLVRCGSALVAEEGEHQLLLVPAHIFSEMPRGQPERINEFVVAALLDQYRRRLPLLPGAVVPQCPLLGG